MCDVVISQSDRIKGGATDEVFQEHGFLRERSFFDHFNLKSTKLYLKCWRKGKNEKA